MKFWKQKDPLALRKQRLAEIERQRIAQHEHLDYHYAMVSMQDEQIARLKEEIEAEESGTPVQVLARSSLFSSLRKIRTDLGADTNG